MDRAQILREISFLELRIADTQDQIDRYREKIEAQKRSGRSAYFETAMLQECQSVLALHLSVKSRLEQQLLVSS